MQCRRQSGWSTQPNLHRPSLSTTCWSTRRVVQIPSQRPQAATKPGRVERFALRQPSNICDTRCLFFRPNMFEARDESVRAKSRGCSCSHSNNGSLNFYVLVRASDACCDPICKPTCQLTKYSKSWSNSSTIPFCGGSLKCDKEIAARCLNFGRSFHARS